LIDGFIALLTVNMAGLFAAGCAGSTAAKPSTPPPIVVPPASQTVTVGQTAAFSVTTTACPIELSVEQERRSD